MSITRTQVFLANIFRHVNARVPYPSLTPIPNPSPDCKLEMFARNTWVSVIDMTPVFCMVNCQKKGARFDFSFLKT